MQVDDGVAGGRTAHAAAVGPPCDESNDATNLVAHVLDVVRVSGAEPAEICHWAAGNAGRRHRSQNRNLKQASMRAIDAAHDGATSCSACN